MTKSCVLAPLSISVIIPAYRSGQHLRLCLEALFGSNGPMLECIVVDDGSQDGTEELAGIFAAKVFSSERRHGPAYARNLGAKAARGDLLLFLDSDICVKSDTLLRIRQHFDADTALDALMGAYDSTPRCQSFLSQYRNLMHAYVHQTGAPRASTFWSGCGAIRRPVFLEHGGFNEKYRHPAIEDIELGYRLVRSGRTVLLDRTIQVTHLKRWTFWGLLKTDILNRGIPWTELILRDWCMPNDLNLQLGQRASVALVCALAALLGTMAVLGGGSVLIPVLTILFMMLARWWVEVSRVERPLRAFTALGCLVSALALLAYSDRMFGLIPILLLSPALLIIRERFGERREIRKPLRWLGSAYICFSVGLGVFYLPAVHLAIWACLVLLALIGLINSRFYLFLAGKRGFAFMLAAIPFHLLYHFYNGISFIIGVTRYTWRAALQTTQPAVAPASSLAPTPEPTVPAISFQ